MLTSLELLKLRLLPCLLVIVVYGVSGLSGFLNIIEGSLVPLPPTESGGGGGNGTGYVHTHLNWPEQPLLSGWRKISDGGREWKYCGTSMETGNTI